MVQLSQHRWFSLRLGVGHAHKPDAPWQKTTWILHNSQTRPGSFFPMCTEHQHTVFSTHTLIMVLTQRHLHPLLYSGAPILCIYSKHWIHSQSTTLLLQNWGGKSELKQLPFFFFSERCHGASRQEGLPHSSMGRTTPPFLWHPQKQLLFIPSPWLGAMSVKKILSHLKAFAD